MQLADLPIADGIMQAIAAEQQAGAFIEFCLLKMQRKAVFFGIGRQTMRQPLIHLGVFDAFFGNDFSAGNQRIEDGVILA